MGRERERGGVYHTKVSFADIIVPLNLASLEVSNQFLEVIN